MLICAACVCRGIVEVAAPLGFIQRSFCCSSALWAIVDQVAAAIKDKPGPARAVEHQAREDALKVSIVTVYEVLENAM